jgi:hypothetical protein
MKSAATAMNRIMVGEKSRIMRYQVRRQAGVEL